MIFVGVDISKYKHHCCIINELGEIVQSEFSFENSREGFAVFLSAVKRCSPEETRIGFESTGHYACNLVQFLDKSGLSYMELNPVLVRQFIRSRTLRKTKTDKLDAMQIAVYLTTVEYKPHPKPLYDVSGLKSLTRFRFQLVKKRSQYLVALTTVLDAMFPEFKPFFGNKFTATALYILENYPTPAKIANMNVRSFDTLRRVSYGRFTMLHFTKLKQLAKDTIGEDSEALQIQLKTLMELHSEIDAKITALEKTISRIVREIDPPLLSIKGVGEQTAAVILAEYGDITRFSSPAKMLSFAGLEPGIAQSGSAEHKGRMVKHGSSYLRYAILRCCDAIMLNNEVFAEYYHKKIAEGKPYNVAKTHLAKKLIRVIYTLETTGNKFDLEKLR